MFKPTRYNIPELWKSTTRSTLCYTLNFLQGTCLNQGEPFK